MDFILSSNIISTQLPYYISRKIQSRNIISKEKVLNHKSSNIFVFTGIDKCQLESILKCHVYSSRKQVTQNKITSHLILLETESDFKDICKITRMPVHWLHYSNKGNGYTLTWVKSREFEFQHESWLCSINQMKSETQVTYTEGAFLEMLKKSNPFCNKNSKPIIISDSVGNGKSTLLKRLGLKLKMQYPDRHILYVVLSEFQAKLKKHSIDKQLFPDDLLNTLSCFMIGEDLERKAFVDGVRTGSVQMELLADGFDEVAYDDKENMIWHLRDISISFSSIRVWITTTPDLLERLEKPLETLGYIIEPLDTQDLISLLVSNGQTQQENKEKLDNEMLVDAANNCLNKLNSCVNENESNRIAGIPLQFMLIAIICKDDPSQISSINHITDLYGKMIATKFSNYLKTYPESTNIDQLYSKHTMLALSSQFPDYQEMFQDKLTSRVMDAELLKIGLVEETFGINDKVPMRFIHKTVSDYFVALYMVTTLKKSRWTEKLTEFLVKEVFKPMYAYSRLASCSTYSFENYSICFFMETMLEEKFDEVPLKMTLKEINQFTPKQVDAICQSCVYNDLVNIFKLMTSTTALDHYGRCIFNKDLVSLSTYHSGTEVFTWICKKFEKYQSKLIEIGPSVLYKAVKRGDIKITDYLLNNHGYLDKVNSSSIKWLLHDCVEYTSVGHNATRLNGKIEIVKILHGINKGLINEKTRDGKCPILGNCVHVKLIEEMIKLGADVEAADNHQDTVLHKILDLKNISLKDFCRILKAIPIESLKKVVKMEARRGHTPLHEAIRYIDLDEMTLQLFQAADADFNSKNHDSDTVIVTAVKSRRSLECLKQLIKHGALCDTTLLHAVAEKGSVGVMEYLISQRGGAAGLKNMKKYDGDSLLHTAVIWGRLDNIQCLIDHGADVNAKNKEGNTPLHQVMLKNKKYVYVGLERINIIKILVENHANVNARNSWKQTPLLGAFEDNPGMVNIEMLECFEMNGMLNSRKSIQHVVRQAIVILDDDDDEAERVIEFLEKLRLKQGVDLKMLREKSNKDTLLHEVARKGSVGVMRYLVGKGLDLNAKNKQIETPLHVALKCQWRDDAEMVQFLFSTGQHDKMFKSGEIVYYSAAHSRFRVFEYVCEKYSSVTQGKRLLDLEEVQNKFKSVLHAAVSRRDLKDNNLILRYLVDSQGFGELLKKPKFHDLIHCLVENTRHYSMDEVFRERENVEFLLERNPELVTGRDDMGRLCWEMENVHYLFCNYLRSKAGPLSESSKHPVDEIGESSNHTRVSFLKRFFPEKK